MDAAQPCTVTCQKQPLLPLTRRVGRIAAADWRRAVEKLRRCCASGRRYGRSQPGQTGGPSSALSAGGPFTEKRRRPPRPSPATPQAGVGWWPFLLLETRSRYRSHGRGARIPTHPHTTGARRLRYPLGLTGALKTVPPPHPPTQPPSPPILLTAWDKMLPRSSLARLLVAGQGSYEKSPSAQAPSEKMPLTNGCGAAAKMPSAKTPSAKTPSAKTPSAKTPWAKTPSDNDDGSAAKTPSANHGDDIGARRRRQDGIVQWREQQRVQVRCLCVFVSREAWVLLCVLCRALHIP